MSFAEQRHAPPLHRQPFDVTAAFYGADQPVGLDRGGVQEQRGPGKGPGKGEANEVSLNKVGAYLGVTITVVWHDGPGSDSADLSPFLLQSV